MTQNHHLLTSERIALKVSGILENYLIDALGIQLAEHPSPSDVWSVASDLMADLMHFASVHGADVPDVLSRAFQNYLEEISGGDAPKETIDQFRAFIDDAIYEVTIGIGADGII